MTSRSIPHHLAAIPITIIVAALAFGLCASASWAANRARPDFNGDGFADLAIGDPDEDLNVGQEAGLVHVVYGSAGGLTATNSQVWGLNSPGIQGTAAAFDLFGAALAWGDFDGDGFDDLAIGAFGQDVNSLDFAGAVHVLYGSPQGLRAVGDQVWTESSPGIVNVPHAEDEFGHALAAGDFDGDGFDDLAIGVWQKDIDAAVDGGAVHVLYGSHHGLRAAGNQFWNADRAGIVGQAQSGDLFGAALATGDFNGDGFADLAVGIPGRKISDADGAGAVQILYGSSQGLRAQHNQLWSQDSPGILRSSQALDGLGTKLAGGDFDGDGFADLAIALPNKDIGSSADAGGVMVLYGSPNGLKAHRNQFWCESSSGLPGAADPGDNFGAALAVGDFNGDGRDDLAIGITGKTIGAAAQAGAVLVLVGSHQGLRAAGAQLLSENTPGIQQTAQAGDEFGHALTAGDFNGNGRTDLAIGVPYKDVGGTADAGIVHVLFGRASGIGVSGDQVWDQETLGSGETSEVGDEFGDYM